MSLSFTLVRNEKIENYIRIKTHKLIVLRFLVENDINVLCGWAQISSVLYLPVKPPLSLVSISYVVGLMSHY